MTKKVNGSYILTACRLEKLADQELFKSANNLVTIMFAIAKMEHGYDFQGIRRERLIVESYVEHFDNYPNAVANEDVSLVVLEKDTVQEIDENGNPIPKNPAQLQLPRQRG